MKLENITFRVSDATIEKVYEGQQTFFRDNKFDKISPHTQNQVLVNGEPIRASLRSLK